MPDPIFSPANLMNANFFIEQTNPKNFYLSAMPSIVLETQFSSYLHCELCFHSILRSFMVGLEYNTSGDAELNGTTRKLFNMEFNLKTIIMYLERCQNSLFLSLNCWKISRKFLFFSYYYDWILILWLETAHDSNCLPGKSVRQQWYNLLNEIRTAFFVCFYRDSEDSFAWMRVIVSIWVGQGGVEWFYF